MIGAQLITEAGLVFSCSSLSPVTPGTCFQITGTTNANCERFSVNLLVVTARRQDIALHINPRLPQNYIVRNSRTNGVWGGEEVTSPIEFRLRRGAPFTLQVLCTESEYYVAVEGAHFASFRHRIPYWRVGALQVYGDVQDVQVDQLSVLQYPEQVGGEQQRMAPLVEALNVAQALAESARIMRIGEQGGKNLVRDRRQCSLMLRS